MPWLKVFLDDDGTFDSRTPPSMTKTGLAHLTVPTTIVPNTFALPPPTTPALDPVPPSSHSLPTLTSSASTLPATPQAPNTMLVSSPPAAPTSKETQG